MGSGQPIRMATSLPGAPAPTPSGRSGRGVALGMAAYLWWGGMVVYMKALTHVSPLEVVVHRLYWSLLFLLALMAVTGRLGPMLRAMRGKRTLATLLTSALLITHNWLLYVWAVQNDLVLQASLGYFINPLFNVLLGTVVLRERLDRRQWASVALAGVGVVSMGIALGRVPLVSLALGGSFAVYGLLRKRVPVDGVTGLAIETLLVLPLVLALAGYLSMSGRMVFVRADRLTDLLLIGLGPASALPLVWFVEAGKRLRYSTLGVMMYTLPSMLFLLAVLVYGEPLGAVRLVSFGCIWIALAIYTSSSLRRNGGVAVTGPSRSAGATAVHTPCACRR